MTRFDNTMFLEASFFNLRKELMLRTDNYRFGLSTLWLVTVTSVLWFCDTSVGAEVRLWKMPHSRKFTSWSRSNTADLYSKFTRSNHDQGNLDCDFLGLLRQTSSCQVLACLPFMVILPLIRYRIKFKLKKNPK